jgi:hypothetical protein
MNAITFTFRNLTSDTRALMVQEINEARARGSLYYSRRFNENGQEAWPGLLLQAAQSYNEHWLAYQLEALNSFKDLEVREKPLGGYTVAHTPNTKAEILADAEFNRYYMLAVCRQALAASKPVTVYRAKLRGEPRPDSEALVGTEIAPAELIPALIAPPKGAPHFLLQPNSGLSLVLA